MATAHNSAEKGDFAKTVLMPGDPLRAKWIAETYLHDVKQVTNVRGILGFTGLTKNNKRISVMASGMGMPSIGIYSHELFSEYDVDAIIRVGTCGSYQPEVKVFDVILGATASTDSAWVQQFDIPQFSAGADFELCLTAYNVAKAKNKQVHVGNILSSDVFYDDDPNLWKKYARLGVLSVEMEAYALYMNAAKLHKKALCLLTVSDSFIEKDVIATPEQRQFSLGEMIEIAIATAEEFAK